MTEMNCSSSYSNEDIQAVPQLFYQALSQVMQHADITRMLELWSEQDDVTYCDPGIHLHLGRSALASYWQRAADANRSSPAKITSTA
ncbi:MAG TPA: hypothetical protein VFB12_17800 [Ktedonobacteraceae bacterium]|nr:hypothetical protein [Ktedonobacteraceae bacterium]